MFDVLEWVYLNCCTFLYFLPDIHFIVDSYFYKLILKGSFGFVHMRISNLDHGLFKTTGWFANLVVFHLFHCGKVALQDV